MYGLVVWVRVLRKGRRTTLRNNIHSFVLQTTAHTSPARRPSPSALAAHHIPESCKQTSNICISLRSFYPYEKFIPHSRTTCPPRKTSDHCKITCRQGIHPNHPFPELPAQMRFPWASRAWLLSMTRRTAITLPRIK